MKAFPYFVIVTIAVLEFLALKAGHDGAMFASSVGAITAVAGYQFGKYKHKKKVEE